MGVVKALALLAVGLVIAYAGTAELAGWRRTRSHRRRTDAEVVGLVEPAATSPGSLSRSPVFRFQTADGRVVEAVSASWGYPPPKLGTRLRISYDPADPERTADRVGVLQLKVVLAPVLVVLGLGLAIFGLTFL
jgi:hypothetical protein